MSKIMRVFYDNAGLPYKDSALSIHYPILEGGEFVGANNTTDIYFYTENLGDFYFVANCKLPNGALVDKLLIAGSDEFGTYYALSLDSELTENKGHLKVALKGYGGDVSIEEESDGETTIVVINGTPTIVATGIVDIAINYAPLVHHISTLTPSEYEELLAVIGTKLNIVNGIYVVNYISNVDLTREGQIYYIKSTKDFYRVENGELVSDGFDEKYAIKAKDNTFTANNTFVYSPQTNEEITDASADTKLATKKYIKDKVDEHLGDYAVLNGKVSAIESKIPSEATPTNKLADKDFVNSTVNSLAAFYITKNAQGDPFDTYAELSSATVFYSGGELRTPTRNDYCMVNADENHDDAACRYIFQGVWGSGGQWEFQFVVNETAFTADQLAAINSGITQALVSQITTNALAIISINSKLPKIKDFVIPTSAWQLDAETGKYYAELDAGNDFVIDDNFMKNYAGTSNNDNSLIMIYGIVASSNATTQKFRFDCLFIGSVPDQIINYTISMYGGN